MHLCILCDTSGSLREGGKRFALLTTLRTIEQCFWVRDASPEVSLFAVNDEPLSADWPDFRYLVDEPKGSFALKKALSLPAVLSADKLLILSDCCWNNDQRRAFRSLKLKRGSDFARAVVIGAEADKQCCAPDFATVENTLALLEEWCP